MRLGYREGVKAEPEASLEQRIARAEEALAAVLGEARAERHGAAQQLGHDAAASLGLAQAQLVYGELDVRSVARILEAADTVAGDRFLDIGSGDGIPTLAAALLFPRELRVCRGIEVVPALAERAMDHAERLRTRLQEHPNHFAAPIELTEGDIYAGNATTKAALGETTLALCFATTWSRSPRRTLPQLSATLEAMPFGARVVVVDARLEGTGWRWEGDLKITPPDTAPYSIARMYTHVAQR